MKSFLRKNRIFLKEDVSSSDMLTLVRLLERESSRNMVSLGFCVASVLEAWKDGRLRVAAFHNTSLNLDDGSNVRIYKTIYGGKARSFRSLENLLPAFVVFPKTSRGNDPHSAEFIWCYKSIRRCGIGTLMLELSGLGTRPRKIRDDSFEFWEAVTDAPQD